MANPTPFQKKLATTAGREFERFHLFRENQDPLMGRIRQYWKELGFGFDSVAVPWSAVFVSWCVKQAGATAAQFKFAAAHAQFVKRAISDAQAGVGLFHGRQLAQYAPKTGDILQNNRSGNHFDFAFAATHGSYESHSAVVVEVGVDNAGKYLRTVGGNEADSVGLKEVRLDAQGRVKNPAGLYICVIETLM
jgi:hypothetical protein